MQTHAWARLACSGLLSSRAKPVLATAQDKGLSLMALMTVRAIGAAASAGNAMAKPDMVFPFTVNITIDPITEILCGPLS
jgi:hypothetical protein